MGVPSKTRDPQLWQTLGATMRLYREAAHLGMREVADSVPVDHSMISKWERGLHQPPANAVKAVDDKLGADGKLVTLHAVLSELAELRAGTLKTTSLPSVEDMDAIRRQLLAGIVSLGTAVTTDMLSGLDGLRDLVDDGVGSSRLGEWEELAWEYALQVYHRPDIVSSLAQDLLAMQPLAKAAPPAEEAGWARVNAQLTYLLAYMLGSAGHARESRQWWASARRAAERAGDRELLAAAHATEAVQALYEKRPIPLVLNRVTGALEAARGRPCRALVRAYGAQAHALALAGDRDGAETALEEQARAFELLPDEVTTDAESAFGWTAERLLHSRSLVYTLTDHPDAEEAQQQALAAYPPHQIRQAAQVELHRAISAVRNGDLVSGLDLARNVLSGLSGQDRTRYVQHVAVTVLESVPVAEASRPRVAEYRECLAIPPGQEN